MKVRPAPVRPWIRLSILLGLLIAAVTPVAAQDLDRVLQAGAETIQLAQASQEKIDEVVEQTETLEAEYQQVLKQLDGLEVYNEYLQRQLDHQEQELGELRASIEQIGTVERQILPLMVRMLDGLEQFIELDLPFLKNERLARVERLRLLLERADVTAAEQFRSLLEAFQIENDFGRTIETYKDTLDLNGATLEVTILRLGRVGLYYQTNDGSATGVWDRSQKAWTPMEGGTARSQVRQGIRIARRLVAPDLLLLDVPAPEVAR